MQRRGQTSRSLQFLAPLHLTLAITSNDPANVGNHRLHSPHNFQHHWPVLFDLMISRTWQQSHDGLLRSSSHFSDGICIDLAFSDLIKERMSDPRRIHTASFIPVILERQSTEHMVDPFAHTFNSPASPTPKLWWQIIVNRNTSRLCRASDPPVEPGEIHEHYGIRRIGVKIGFGLLH